ASADGARSLLAELRARVVGELDPCSNDPLKRLLDRGVLLRARIDEDAVDDRYGVRVDRLERRLHVGVIRRTRGAEIAAHLVVARDHAREDIGDAIEAAHL